MCHVERLSQNVTDPGSQLKLQVNAGVLTWANSSSSSCKLGNYCWWCWHRHDELRWWLDVAVLEGEKIRHGHVQNPAALQLRQRLGSVQRNVQQFLERALR